ncbi:dTDP-glucose 4,6-dehydratase [Methylopila henanensis]|uniref:dTDP-glucose 4,6-dehydratase n=1 Tax=Methylopila henanensis TaxID=873516 RepID=A0ABW4K8I7_9HYPH
MKRRTLVTGGCGFIGSALTRRLVADGRDVLNLDALTYAASPEAVAECATSGRYAFRRADICDADAVSEALAAFRPDGIVHCAAETHVDRSIDAPEAFVRTNALGTERLLSATLAHWRRLPPDERESFRFVQVSTDEVFGALGPDDPPFTAASRYAPRSPYAASKAAGDHIAEAFRATFGLPTLTVHGCNAYGPWQAPEKLAPLTIARLRAGEPVELYGDGRQRRDWLFVDDVAEALERALDRGAPGDRFLIAGGAERENREMVGLICDLVDARLGPLPGGARRRTLIRRVADRPGHDFRYALDDAATRAALGWTPRVGFEQGLAATVDWCLQNAEWLDSASLRLGRGRRGLGGG